MAIKYTEEQLNSVDKSMLIQMFLNQQEQLEKVSADSFLIIKQIQAIYREEGKLKELSSKESHLLLHLVLALLQVSMWML